MKMIPLTQGKVALVDDEDYERLMQYRWFAQRTGTEYRAARRTPRVNGKQGIEYLHRVVIEVPEKAMVDHRNHDPLDNRKANLRICSNAENQMNSRIRPGKVFKGISFIKGRWRVRVQQHWVGYFDSREEAARAYDKKAREVFGEFVCENFATG